MTTRGQVIEALMRGDGGAAAALLDPEAVFHSPVRSYRGAERITALWQAIGDVLRDTTVTRVLEDEDDSVAFFDGVAAGEAIDGVLRVRGGDGAPVYDVTLMLRPYQALKGAIAEMSRRLAAEP